MNLPDDIGKFGRKKSHWVEGKRVPQESKDRTGETQGLSKEEKGTTSMAQPSH